MTTFLSCRAEMPPHQVPQQTQLPHSLGASPLLSWWVPAPGKSIICFAHRSDPRVRKLTCQTPGSLVRQSSPALDS